MYNIDTSNKQKALSSITKIFAHWSAKPNGMEEYSEDAYKLYPFSSFEVVTDVNGNYVTSDLVKGTFNFINPGLPNFADYKLHFMYDVYPYIIWGNSNLDNSNFIERFIWNYDSIDPLTIFYEIQNDFQYTFISYRGDSLYNQLIIDDFFCVTDTALITLIFILLQKY